jgi:histidinol phosphatase-like PHP family hydrolase
MDLHLHTPASSDYQEPPANYLDVLQRADARSLDIIAFTDHNTVAGYRRLRDEIEELELLERLNRMRPDEKHRLEEYRRLLGKILVLPGFEFTATFGFHILGLFPPETPVRDIEHLLLSLNIPSDQLDKGSATVGATADVLTAYRLIAEAGGLAIAAHANSSNGVAMRGFTFGGQTKIAYTQDPHLHALEVTDLEQKGRRGTAGFFNGSKPEYPRRMHCIQGSDAHRLKRDPSNAKNLGIGERATDVHLEEASFEALRQLFLSSDFARTRPHTGAARADEFDYVQQAREEGPSIVQSFHEAMTQRGGRLFDVVADVCAFANTNGGTVYVGASADPKQRLMGVENAAQAVQELHSAIDRMLTPRLDCTVDTLETKGKTVIRVLVPRGDDPPYALDDNKIYLREEAETSLAVRDEIVQLVLRGRSVRTEAPPHELPEAAPELPRLAKPGIAPVAVSAAPVVPEPLRPPRTGVEVVATEERDGRRYHTVRDLRNGNTVKNVTRASARKLWHYAITEHESGTFDPAVVTWHGNLGLWKKTHRGGVTRYDLVERGSNGDFRIYYGVTEDGVHGEWKAVVGGEEE